MGDRAQIAIKSQYEKNGAKVYLYGHWIGVRIYDVLKTVIKRGAQLDDAEYLARIIFCEMIKGEEDTETGYGISTSAHGDIEHPIPVLDCGKQEITFEPAPDGEENPPEGFVITFKDFINFNIPHNW
ncbi:MAG: hypothetical protein OEV59_05090 [Deltaproteobacteria bacterium]|nr:hypothetical protein [Deltaproteobacteria bacterium]